MSQLPTDPQSPDFQKIAAVGASLVTNAVTVLAVLAFIPAGDAAGLTARLTGIVGALAVVAGNAYAVYLYFFSKHAAIQAQADASKAEAAELAGRLEASKAETANLRASLTLGRDFSRLGEVLPVALPPGTIPPAMPVPVVMAPPVPPSKGA